MESVEVQLARIQEQLKIMGESQQEEKDHRRRREAQMQEMTQVLINLNNRMEAVEKQLATNAPTIDEFIRIKHQVNGAGVFGKWLWAVGGFLIAFVYSGRTHIRDFLLK